MGTTDFLAGTLAKANKNNPLIDVVWPYTNLNTVVTIRCAKEGKALITNGKESKWIGLNFLLTVKKPKPKKLKLVIGLPAKIVSNFSQHGFRLGSAVRLVKAFKDGFVCKNKINGEWYVLPCDLKRIGE